MVIKQFDVKTAFLYGDLSEEVYMKQPTGFNDGSSRVCKLIKSLYGLKQAPRCWNAKFTNFISEFQFKETEADPCVFMRKIGDETTFLALFVDDGLLFSASNEFIEPVVKYLQKHFEIKISEANYFLGFEINRMNDGSIFLSQESYNLKIAKHLRL